MLSHKMNHMNNNNNNRANGHHRSNASCAACKFLKRRCTPTCIFAPYFRSDEPKKFIKVHKVFGASNVGKILVEVPEEQREDTVNSLAYEAEARLRDPVYGCIGAIALLQRRMFELQHDLELARARLARCTAAAAAHQQVHGNIMSSSGGGGDGAVVLDGDMVVVSGRELEDRYWGFNENQVGVLYDGLGINDGVVLGHGHHQLVGDHAHLARLDEFGQAHFPL